MLRCVMRTTLTIPDDVYRSAKAYAARTGVPIGSVVETALRLLLAESADDRPVAELPVFPHFAPAPGVDFTRTSELLHDLESGA